MNKIMPGKRSRDPKTYTVTLRTADMVWMGVGAALALSIFFLFGLLIGRGYVATAPEEGDPGQSMHAVQDSGPGGIAGGVVDMNGTQALADDQKEQPAAPVVLQPEDLNYPEKLAQNHPGVPSGPTESAKSAAKGQKSAAPAKSAKPAPDEGPEEGAAFDASQPAPGESSFRYVYQVAAFKDAAQAKVLAQRLAAKGMSTDVAEASVKGQTWHRVQVLFTGTPSQTEPLRAAIEGITGQKPIRVSKKTAN